MNNIEATPTRDAALTAFEKKAADEELYAIQGIVCDLSSLEDQATRSMIKGEVGEALGFVEVMRPLLRKAAGHSDRARLALISASAEIAGYQFEADQQRADMALQNLVAAMREAYATTPMAADLAFSAYVAVFGFRGIRSVAAALNTDR